MNPPELVERIWERDPSVWTGADEANWLGWLDEPIRMLERVDDLYEFAAGADYDASCSRDGRLEPRPGGDAPLVRDRRLPRPRHHPSDRDPPPGGALDLERTLFVVSSKSGSTVETRSHADYFFDRAAGTGSASSP